MAPRSAVQRVVARAYREFNFSPSLTGQSRVSPGVAQAVPCVDFQGHDRSGGSWRKDWKEDFTSTSHVAKRTGFSHEIMGKSSDSDSGEEPNNRWAVSGIEHHPVDRRNWDRTVNFIAMKNEKDARREFSGNASAQTSAELGSCVRFLGHGFGHVVPSTRLGNVCPRAWKAGSMFSSRAFSSVPAVSVDGAQISSSVDRELLDSSQAGLSGISEAGAAITSLPSSSVSQLSEVAVAAADCSVPTAFIQYVIDYVHVNAGLPWWLSIVATTAAIRVLVLPLMIYQMKSTARLTLLRPELEKLTNRIKESNYDPKVVEDNQIRMKALFQEHKTTPFSPVLGAFIQAPIFMCFFFAIRNMAEKMESFKDGGALWFTDLSTPDSLYILPVMSGAFFLLTIELGATDGMQGQPMLGKMKMVLRGLALLLVPLTASFPKALFCYWLTANVFSIFQAAVFKQPGVKAALGIPDVSHLAPPLEMPVSPVVTFSQNPRSKVETPVVTFSQHRRSKGASSKRQG